MTGEGRRNYLRDTFLTSHICLLLEDAVLQLMVQREVVYVEDVSQPFQYRFESEEKTHWVDHLISP